MTRVVKVYNREVFKQRTEEHKFAKGQSGLIFCKICNAVYYKKSWHKNLRNYKYLRDDLNIKFSICPADAMIKNNQFEGEIIIENSPANLIESLIHLTESFCHRAEQKDSQHRLIKIERMKNNNLMITTTENQLAVKLAKKIKDAFKNAKVKISYSPAPSDTAYVKIKFD